MRTYTILFSIVAHALVVVAVIVSTVTATDVLPEPRRATIFIVVKPAVPVTPPSPPRVVQQRAPVVSSNAAPIEAPEGVTAERALDPIADAPDPDAAVGAGLSPVAPALEPPPPPPNPQPRAPVRPGGDIRPPVKVYNVTPVYPRIAQDAHVAGVVILEAVIAEDGSMRDVRVLRGHPLLDQAALDAVRQWRFTPTLLNGQPVPVVMTVTVAFGLH